MKGDNIAVRLRVFAASVVWPCRRLPDDAAVKHIARQLVRAATGGGANAEEARGAESRADFIHEVGIANKDLREALYWLQLTEEAALVVDGELSALFARRRACRDPDRIHQDREATRRYVCAPVRRRYTMPDRIVRFGLGAVHAASPTERTEEAARLEPTACPGFQRARLHSPRRSRRPNRE